eukprot:CAMPEP_0171777258 /NCGR_PEP_ID=MMETSP0991-20121206/57680_1 /TAXON_ID=483369 /ORGANISM="non described non described, Strain CCMP2098" /LENGTH=345 /DNA_ID=CAMNT_0012383949 /DNA_START=12 /DNA_END=1049 /DNA_ORIENTATION=+
MASSNVQPSEIFKAGNVAVITGASSGIGRATARRCASLGMKVVMADVDVAELAQAKAEVQSLASNAEDVLAVPTDVSSQADVEALKELTLGAFGGQCHFLMNNAGIQLLNGGPLETGGTWEKTLAVNTWGPIYGCQAFVPAMQASGQPGLVVNTGSKQGITAPPGNLAYNMSKAALKCFTEGLEHDLRNSPSSSGATSKVHAALLVPGWVNTSIALKPKRKAAAAAAAVAAAVAAAAAEAEGGSAGDAQAAAAAATEAFDAASVFHEGNPASAAWMPDQVVDFMLEELSKNNFYIICPDNDVTREVDNLRMTWAMQDVTENRAPLSRWHPDYKDAFAEYVSAGKK